VATVRHTLQPSVEPHRARKSLVVPFAIVTSAGSARANASLGDGPSVLRLARAVTGSDWSTGGSGLGVSRADRTGTPSAAVTTATLGPGAPAVMLTSAASTGMVSGGHVDQMQVGRRLDHPL
jgi:hypothetical protein